MTRIIKSVVFATLLLTFLAVAVKKLILYFSVPQYNLVYCKGPGYPKDIQYENGVLLNIYTEHVENPYKCFVFDPQTSSNISTDFYERKDRVITSTTSPDGYVVRFLDQNTIENPVIKLLSSIKSPSLPDAGGVFTAKVYVTKYPLSLFKRYVDTSVVPGETLFVVGWYKTSRK